MCYGSAPNVPLQNRTDADLQQLAKVQDAYIQSLQSSDRPGQFGGFGGNPWLAIQLGASKEAQRILEERKQQRNELERIAKKRTQLAANQQAEMQRLQEAQVLATAEQQRTVQDLQAQEQRQQTELAGARLATQAAAASMQTLQPSNAGTTAPTAKVTRPDNSRRRRASTGSSLRIGQTAAGAGVGINIGG